MKKENILKVFEAHGVEFVGERGTQMYGYDPFSGKDDKFYVNKSTGLWDSKSAGLSGNVAKFLELRAEAYAENLKGNLIRHLAEHRQISRNAFYKLGMGWDGRTFTFPIKDFDGHVQDIRRYSMKSRTMMSTAGCKTGLLGAHQLKLHPDWDVYLCEGEWDAIALRYLLGLVKEEAVVLGLPGAGTFKDEWVRGLQGRRVFTLYDADTAGQKGEELCIKRLTGQVKELKFIHWPDEVPIGFDTRDWIVYGVTMRQTPEMCWERLQRRFFSKPKWETPDPLERLVRVRSKKTGRIRLKKKKISESLRWKIPPSLDQVHEVFNKWLFLKNVNAIDVMLATVLSQRIDGSPVWTFLVGPPGSAKTAIVNALQEVQMAYSTSTLTAPSLISGANFTGAGDPSLIPQLNDKVLVVKDFTSILSLPDREQKEIFGILRDAYDGNCGKQFGNGIVRRYKSRFTILAATTPRIYDLAEQHAALGERFIKFMVGDNLHHEQENDVIRRAIENADRETKMRGELQDVCKAFLERTCKDRPIPTLPDKLLIKIVALAKFGARMRGSVSRDFYRNDLVTSRPMAEVGTRLGQQLAKLARGLAMLYERTEVTSVEYDLIKKVMLDTISQRNEDVLKTLIGVMGGAENLTAMSMRDISVKTHYPFETIRRLMQDLHALQIIRKQGGGATSTWTLTDYVRNEIITAELYRPEEITPVVGRIRIRRRKKREYKRSIRIPSSQVIPVNGSAVQRMTITVPSAPVIDTTEKPDEQKS